MSDAAPLPNPRQMFCPHCGTENPPYDFIIGSGKNLRVAVQFATVVCNALVTPQPCAVCHGRLTQRRLPENDDVPCAGCDGVAKRSYYCRRILPVSILACEITPGLL
jgi:hypothetical protein